MGVVAVQLAWRLSRRAEHVALLDDPAATCPSIYKRCTEELSITKQ